MDRALNLRPFRTLAGAPPIEAAGGGGRMTRTDGAGELEADLATHRSFAVALGGFVLEIAGGSLVTHERIAVPAFNYVDLDRLAPDRLAAFFERALDHYFQRAIRPSFRAIRPVPPHVDRTLGSLGFVPGPDPWVVLRATSAGDPGAPEPPLKIESVRAGDELAPLWAHEREQAELRRSLEVLLDHPNPGEHLDALVARENGPVVGCALVYERDGAAGIHAVATQPAARGRGVATAMVRSAMNRLSGRGVGRTVLLSAVPRLAPRLAPLGFHEVGQLVEYTLPTDAVLAVPPSGPPAPPRWRPPRRP
jgi:GNAT superfamily N-acetyltransferase